MTDWQCPNCGGGFPDSKLGECPWCGQMIDGSYEHEPKIVSRVAEKRDDESPGLLARFR